MVQTPEQQAAEWHGLIDDGLQLAAAAALVRLGGEEAVTAEFQRVGAILDDALNGEPNDVATLVLHAALVSLLEKSVER